MYSFSEMIGHTDIKKNLQNAIESGKVSHAYIVNSKDCISRDDLAKAFAKTIQCESHKKDACLSCASCKSFDHKNHADVVYITMKNSKSISVESIREELVNDINIRPYKSTYKIYIIENADKMTVAAQNSLLKTIESPYSYAVILLLTDNYKSLLDTILSRCIIIDMKPLSNEVMSEYIKIKYNNMENNIYLPFAEGSISKLEDIINSEKFIELRNLSLQISNMINNLNIESMISIEKIFVENKENVEQILDLLIMWYRDMNIIKNNILDSHLINNDKVDEIKEQAQKISFNMLSRIINNIYMIKNSLKSNVNLKLAINVMMLNIKG